MPQNQNNPKKYKKCQYLACNIQVCLQKYGHNVSKCKSAIDELKECCIATSKEGVNKQTCCEGHTREIKMAYEKSV